MTRPKDKSPLQLVNESIRIVDIMQRKIKPLVQKFNVANGDQELFMKLCKTAGTLSTKSKDLLDTLRKYEKDVSRVVDTLTNEEKRVLFLEFFAEQSRERQVEMFQEFAKVLGVDLGGSDE